jgi:Ca2+-binding EF-hand superfamily protein
LEEMTRYLTSVFKVMYETQPGTAERMGVSAEELAVVTAEQAFKDADVNHDGRLSFEEFQKWYAAPTGQSVQTVSDATPSWVSLKEVRRLTALENHDVEEVFEEFAVAADDEGLLDAEAFAEVFQSIIARNGGQSEADSERTSQILSRLFDIFDVDGSGAVDFSELASGLSVLCGGTRDQKAEAAFALYDYNGDGFISLEEMTRYLTSVFKVMYETQPGTAERMGVSAEELAVVTAEQAFEDADVNHDGRLSFEEFQKWYSSIEDGSETEEKQVVEEKEEEAETEEEDDDDDTFLNDAFTSSEDDNDDDFDSEDDSYLSSDLDSEDYNIPISLAEARKLTGLGETDVELAFSLFAEVTDEDGLINFRRFSDVFIDIVTSRDDAEETDRSKLSSLLIRLFGLFDTDSNGSVDFSELASGISVLCGGTSQTKVREAFGLFDFNGDGYISLVEFSTYLASVYKTMFMLQPETQAQIGASPEELARVTAEECFAESDVDLDGRLCKLYTYR